MSAQPRLRHPRKSRATPTAAEVRERELGDVAAVSALTGLPPVAIHKLRKDPTSGFPRPVHLPGRSERRPVFRIKDVAEWAASLPTSD